MKWISLKDEKPDVYDEVLITDGYEVGIGSILTDGAFMEVGGTFRVWEPTHWMPLPEPPEDKKWNG